MSIIAEWPSPLRCHLLCAHGEPVGVDDLGGMSDGAVWRVRFPAGSVVVKRSPNEREFNFYGSIARSLSAQGVATPHLEWSGRGDDSNWLVLEDIPEPLPSNNDGAWRPDSRVVRTLATLHAITPDGTLDLASLFEPRWKAGMNEAALSLFEAAVTANLTPALESLRLEAQRLFAPECWISGDPNPRNWGVRADGTVVLFDWERFGRGTPALDLAIIVPGLGDGATYRIVAGDYVSMRDLAGRSIGRSADQLAREISLAKVWTVVEFLAEYARGLTTETEEVANWLVEAVPPWIASIAGK